MGSTQTQHCFPFSLHKWPDGVETPPEDGLRSDFQAPQHVEAARTCLECGRGVPDSSEPMYEVLENGSIKQNVAFLHTQVVYFFYKVLQPTEALGFNTVLYLYSITV